MKQILYTEKITDMHLSQFRNLGSLLQVWRTRGVDYVDVPVATWKRVTPIDQRSTVAPKVLPTGFLKGYSWRCIYVCSIYVCSLVEFLSFGAGNRIFYCKFLSNKKRYSIGLLIISSTENQII